MLKLSTVLVPESVLMSKSAGPLILPGQELQQQVAQLQAEYMRVGDQLESEQTRIMQVTSGLLVAAVLVRAHSCCS